MGVFPNSIGVFTYLNFSSIYLTLILVLVCIKYFWTVMVSVSVCICFFQLYTLLYQFGVFSILVLFDKFKPLFGNWPEALPVTSETSRVSYLTASPVLLSICY